LKIDLLQKDLARKVEPDATPHADSILAYALNPEQAKNGEQASRD
jgi:hypothetical protein